MMCGCCQVVKRACLCGLIPTDIHAHEQTSRGPHNCANIVITHLRAVSAVLSSPHVTEAIPAHSTASQAGIRRRRWWWRAQRRWRRRPWRRRHGPRRRRGRRWRRWRRRRRASYHRRRRAAHSCRWRAPRGYRRRRRRRCAAAGRRGRRERRGRRAILRAASSLPIPTKAIAAYRCVQYVAIGVALGGAVCESADSDYG